MLMIIMLSLRLLTIPGDDLYRNCMCHHSSLTDVQTAATAVTDHHTDDELVHNVNRVKWHNNCNGDEVDTIVLMKTIKTIYSVPCSAKMTQNRKYIDSPSYILHL